MATTQQVQLPAGYEDAQPVQSSASPVQLPAGYEDAQPVNTPVTFGSSVKQGLGEAGGDVWSFVRRIASGAMNTDVGPSVASAAKDIPGGPQVIESIQHIIPMLHAYEQSRSQGKGVVNSLVDASGVNQKIEATKQAVNDASAAYKKNPTAESTRALADASTAAAAYWGTGKVLGEAAPEEAAGAETEAATEAPEPGILKPGYQDVAGYKVPVRAQGTTASIAEPLADQAKLKAFEVNKTQPAVRNAAANITAEAAGIGRLEPVSKSDAFGFGDAAAQLEATTKEGFQKVDDFSGKDFSNAQAQADTARGSLDYAGKVAYKQAMQTQSDLIDAYGKAHPDEDVTTLKADWRQKSGLDELATRFNRTVGPTPSELTKPGEPNLGYVNPTTFRNSVIDATQNKEFEKAGFTPEHIQSMEDLGNILDQAKPASGLNATVESIAKYMGRRVLGSAIGGIVGGVPGAIVGALGEHGGEWLVGKYLGRVMTDLPSLQTMTEGLAAGVSANTVGKAVAEQLAKSPQNMSDADLLKQGYTQDQINAGEHLPTVSGASGNKSDVMSHEQYLNSIGKDTYSAEPVGGMPSNALDMMAMPSDANGISKPMWASRRAAFGGPSTPKSVYTPDVDMEGQGATAAVPLRAGMAGPEPRLTKGVTGRDNSAFNRWSTPGEPAVEPIANQAPTGTASKTMQTSVFNKLKSVGKSYIGYGLTEDELEEFTHQYLFDIYAADADAEATKSGADIADVKSAIKSNQETIRKVADPYDPLTMKDAKVINLVTGESSSMVKDFQGDVQNLREQNSNATNAPVRRAESLSIGGNETPTDNEGNETAPLAETIRETPGGSSLPQPEPTEEAEFKFSPSTVKFITDNKGALQDALGNGLSGRANLAKLNQMLESPKLLSNKDNYRTLIAGVQKNLDKPIVQQLLLKMSMANLR